MTDPLNAQLSDSYPHSKGTETNSTDDSEFSNLSAASLNSQLNELFKQRLEYIQRNNPNDLQVTLLAYQEWINALLRSTVLAIKQKEEIEENILQKLKPFHHTITTNVNEVGLQCLKCRWDIDKLIEYIQREFHYKNADMSILKMDSKLIFKNPEEI